MRRLLFNFVLVFIYIVVSFSFIDEVDAAVDYNHIYHITSFDIDTGSSVVTVEGFAFIDHMDNYGGINLRTFLMASNGGSSYEVPVTYIQSDSYDYYWARCQESVNGDACTLTHAEMVKTSDLRRNNCAATRDADCAYFSVEFTASIDLNDLYNRLGSQGDISFKIRTENDINNTVFVSDLGVHRNNCKVDGIPNSCGQVNIGDSVINVRDVSDRVRVTTVYGRIRYADDWITKNGIYYNTGSSFSVDGYYKSGSFNKDGVSFLSNYYVILGSEPNNNSVRPGTAKKYIIYDSWVQTEGSIKISFGDSPLYNHSDGACDPGYTEVYASKTATCGDGQHDFKACVRKGITTETLTYTLSNAEYRNATRNGNELACGTNGDYSRDVSFNISTDILIHQGGTFIFNSINESTIYAGRGFSFPSITYNNDIYWKSASNWSSDQIVIRYGGWVDNGYDEETDTCIRPDRNRPIYNVIRETCSTRGISSDGQSCTPGEWVEIRGSWTGTYECAEYETIHHEVWQCDPYKNTVVVNYSDYFSQLNEAAKKTVDNNVNVNNIQGSIPVSYDSNVVSSVEKDVAGSWDTVYAVNDYDYHNSIYSTKYEFVMDDAYVKLVGDNAGNVKYSTTAIQNYQNVGKKYYVPLLFPNNRIFPLNIKQNNISLVSGINWYLDGICYIVPVNTVFDCDNNNCTSKFRYRPIDLSNPFPKGVIPDNWQGWYSSDTNKKRIANTYANGLKYSVTLARGYSANGKLGIDAINAIDTDYNSWAGMNTNGTSSFINNNSSYFTKPSVSSWCEIGKFDASCDK